MKRPLEVKVVLIISLLLFIASLGMPALEFREHPPVRGLTCLLFALGFGLEPDRRDRCLATDWEVPVVELVCTHE